MPYNPPPLALAKAAPGPSLHARNEGRGPVPEGDPVRVLVILGRFPEPADTYARTQIRALRDGFEFRVVSLEPPERPCHVAYPVERIDLADVSRMLALLDAFRPRVLHAHNLRYVRYVAWLARRRDVPYTIQVDGTDAAAGPSARWPSLRATDAADVVNGERCLGILAPRFLRPLLERAGVRAHRIHDSPPAVDFARFHDESPNGEGVIGVGTAIPSRRMTALVDLARLMPATTFDLYCAGRDAHFLAKYNRERGAPAALHAPVAHREMPARYKRRAWLVHTASPSTGGCAWPLSVLEAQAAGLGVCVPDVYPHAAEMLGGAGVVYRDIAEVPEIVARGYPDEMRVRGFEAARRCDFARHKPTLAALWERCG